MFNKSIAALILLSAFVAATEAQRYGNRVRLMGAHRHRDHNRRLDASTYNTAQLQTANIAAATNAAAQGYGQVQSSAGAAGAVSQANGLFGSSTGASYMNNSVNNQSALYQAVGNNGAASSNNMNSASTSNVASNAYGASLGAGNSGSAATNTGGQAYANGVLGGSSGASYLGNTYLAQSANGYAYTAPAYYNNNNGYAHQ